MRELIGFAVGAATGAAAALLATAPEGRAFIQRLREDAEPELVKAADDLEPVARNVVRAARLALDDLGVATEGLRAWIAEAAAGVVPADGEAAAPLVEDGISSGLETADGETEAPLVEDGISSGIETAPEPAEPATSPTSAE